MNRIRGAFPLSSRTFSLIIGAGLLTAVTACGSSGLYGSSGSGSSGSGSGSSGGGSNSTLKITSPHNGATVHEPFKLAFTASVPIGPTDSGKDHVHVFADGNTNNYQVITASPAMVKGLKPGKHTIGVTLQHADHSPVGPKAQITVVVTGGSGGANSSPSSGGYGY